MIFYGNHESGHSFKVRSFLLMADIPHDYRWIDLTLARKNRPEDFRAASQFGEVPVLVDEGQTLCQSNSILMHLAQKHHVLCGTPDEWTRITEWLSWESNRIGFSIPNLRFALRWSPQPDDVLNYLRQRARADLHTLNHFLTDSEFLVASGCTIADISCSAYLFWLDQAGFDIADYPHIERWLEQIRTKHGWLSPEEVLTAV